MKYQIIKHIDGEFRVQIEKKFLWWRSWKTMSYPCSVKGGVYRRAHEFHTIEEARKFVDKCKIVEKRGHWESVEII